MSALRQYRGSDQPYRRAAARFKPTGLRAGRRSGSQIRTPDKMRRPTTRRSIPHMAKPSRAVPDSFEVDVVSLLRGQVDAIVHELAVAISDIQSGFPEEEAEDYLYGKLEDLVPAMREQS